MDVASNFFLTKNSKGNPCCAEKALLNKVGNTVHNSPKEGKRKHAISYKKQRD
jgi:hypothetical protein